MANNINTDAIVTIVSRVCKRSHRYATDFDRCPVCTEIKEWRSALQQLVDAQIVAEVYDVAMQVALEQLGGNDA